MKNLEDWQSIPSCGTPGSYHVLIDYHPFTATVTSTRVKPQTGTSGVENILKYLHPRGDRSTIDALDEPVSMEAFICDFIDKRYAAKTLIEATVERYKDEVLAIRADLELYGEGSDEISALTDLECELLDLYEYLQSIPRNKLGEKPRAWLKILRSLIKKSGN
jgi:hypothetical protein